MKSEKYNYKQINKPIDERVGYYYSSSRRKEMNGWHNQNSENKYPSVRSNYRAKIIIIEFI